MGRAALTGLPHGLPAGKPAVPVRNGAGDGGCVQADRGEAQNQTRISEGRNPKCYSFNPRRTAKRRKAGTCWPGLSKWSGRRGLNPRRSAWEADPGLDGKGLLSTGARQVQVGRKQAQTSPVGGARGGAQHSYGRGPGQTQTAFKTSSFCPGNRGGRDSAGTTNPFTKHKGRTA